MDFIIDFDEIIKDMNFATRQIAVNRLKRCFKEGIDFEIKKQLVNRPQAGRVQGYKYHLTEECAEAFAKVKTKNDFYNVFEIAGLHRIYPYQVRNILDKYNIPHIHNRSALFYDMNNIVVSKKVYLENIDKFKVKAIPPALEMI